jgi:hypothetical protein
MKKFRLVLFLAVSLFLASTHSNAEIFSNKIGEQHFQPTVSTNSSFHPIKRHKQRKHRHGLRHKRAVVVIRRRFR